MARRHRAGIAEFGRELPAILAPHSPDATAIERDDLVPGLREVLEACRRLEGAARRDRLQQSSHDRETPTLGSPWATASRMGSGQRP